MTTKESGVIETPVYFDVDARIIFDANDHTVCEVDAEGLISDADADGIAAQIVLALNTAAATEQRLAACIKALEEIRDYTDWSKSWDHPEQMRKMAKAALRRQALAQQHPSQRERTADFIKELRSGGKVTSDDLSIVINARPSQSEVSDECLGGCGHQEPYGFVPESGCPVHDPEG